MPKALAWLLVGLALAGCAGPTVTSLSPSGASGPTEVPSQPTSAPTALTGATAAPTGPAIPMAEPTGPSWTPRPAAALLTGSAVRVLVDRLNVRAKPTVDANSLGVVTPQNVLAVESIGPFAQDGYIWYRAKVVSKNGALPALSQDLDQPDALGGWIAVAKGRTDYVRELKPRCPAAIDLASIQNMLGSELLACFGSNSIELTGTFGCGGCGGTGPGSSEPGWLTSVFTGNLLSIYPIQGGQLNVASLLHFPPDGATRPADGEVIRVRGHFDDPAARTCRFTVPDPLRPSTDNLVPVDAAAAQLFCSEKFVVESVEVLGVDPGFPYG